MQWANSRGLYLPVKVQFPQRSQLQWSGFPEATSQTEPHSPLCKCISADPAPVQQKYIVVSGIKCLVLREDVGFVWVVNHLTLDLWLTGWTVIRESTVCSDSSLLNVREVIRWVTLGYPESVWSSAELCVRDRTNRHNLFPVPGQMYELLTDVKWRGVIYSCGGN